MKIGYLLDVFPKTSETFVANEIVGLGRTDDVRIFSVDREDTRSSFSGEVVYYKRRLIKEGAGAVKAGLTGELLGKSPKEHFFHMVADYFFKDSKDLDVLHRHFATNSMIYYLARKLKIPYTVTTHAWDIFSRERYAHIEDVLKNAARIITISNYNKSYMIDNFGLNPEKIEVVRMGINPESFSGFSEEPDLLKILSVGRMVEKKGFEYAILSIGLLKKSHPDITYTIVGVGPKEAQLRSLVTKLGLGDNVRFTGKLSQEALIDEYKKAGCFILPCVTVEDGDMDGIPVVLMEAMAMQKAVISTGISGIPELIRSRENGILVDQKDPEALAAAVEDIISGKFNKKDLGLAARKTVIEGFNIKNQVDHMRKIFEDVIS